MSFVERANGLIDWELARKTLFVLSAALLVLIPADGLWIHSQRSKPIHADAVSQDRPSVKFEPEASYLAVFDRSALFGSASSGLSASASQTSVLELTKDYRLKGVILGDESEAIVEDAKTQKTVFVKAGGQLGDGLTVKEIKEGFIVLTYLGQDVKLEIQ